MVEKYLDGQLPMPGVVLQGLLKGMCESYFRWSPSYPELPPEWSGFEATLRVGGGALGGG